jgi:hypothetical protein
MHCYRIDIACICSCVKLFKKPLYLPLPYVQKPFMLSPANKRYSVTARRDSPKKVASEDSVPVIQRLEMQPVSDDPESAVDVAGTIVIETEEVLADTCASALATASPLTSPVRPAGSSQRDPLGSPVGPESPGTNRARFMANCQPLKVCCDLTTIGLHNASMRFSFQAVVLIVYPPSEKPERRHLQLIDSRGSTGLTVWGPHVAMFSSSSVGQVVRFSKLALISHNGTKGLTMSRDSQINVVSSATENEEAKWWLSLLSAPPKRIIDVHDCDDNIIVSFAGILGTLWSETKQVLR